MCKNYTESHIILRKKHEPSLHTGQWTVTGSGTCSSSYSTSRPTGAASQRTCSIRLQKPQHRLVKRPGSSQWPESDQLPIIAMIEQKSYMGKPLAKNCPTNRVCSACIVQLLLIYICTSTKIAHYLKKKKANQGPAAPLVIAHKLQGCNVSTFQKMIIY